MKNNATSKSTRLLEAPVGKTMVGLAAPMAIGLAAVILFNVVDTLYVGRLGATELAAMSFTFPVVYTVMSLAMGLGAGVTSAISRAIGEGDRVRVCRLTTDGLILANTIVVFFAILGLVSVGPLFRLLGADESLLPLIKSYMNVWYLGVGFLVIPMVGNSAIRATGDTKTPAYVMMVAGGVNVLLDPLFIFGPGPFPRLELQGAAIATVTSWTVTFVAALWILNRRERMLVLKIPPVRAVLASWGRILYVGVPAAATQVMVPIAAGVLTRVVARYGPDSVAAYGVGTRIESLAMVGAFAMSSAAAPFMGQNYGARNFVRVRNGLSFSLKACLVYGLIVAGALYAGSRPLAHLFNDHDVVRHLIVMYLSMVPLSYGLYGIALVVNSTFNAANKPINSVILIVSRLFVITIPFALVGAHLGGMPGIFVGVAVGNAAGGALAIAMGYKFVRLSETDVADNTRVSTAAAESV